MRNTADNDLLGLVAELTVSQTPVTGRTGGEGTRTGMLNRSLVRDVETVVSGDDLVGRSGDSLDDALMDEPITLLPEADGAELRGQRYSIF